MLPPRRSLSSLGRVHVDAVSADVSAPRSAGAAHLVEGFVEGGEDRRASFHVLAGTRELEFEEHRPSRRVRELARRREAQNAKGWKPAQARPRKISAALKAYAKLVTSADTGAVRDLSLLDD